MAGNTSDNTTLADFLTKIEDQYGRSDRVWIMDRGIPTEQTLEAMREGDTPVRYLVGTPAPAREVIPRDPLARSAPIGRCQAPDQRRGALCAGAQRTPGAQRAQHAPAAARLGELRRQSNRRDQLMLKLGAAKKDAGRAWFLVEVDVPRRRAGRPRAHLPPASETAPSVSPRGPLPVALEHDRRRPRRAPLHAAHQGAQAQSCHPAHLPSARAAH